MKNFSTNFPLLTKEGASGQGNLVGRMGVVKVPTQPKIHSKFPAFEAGVV